MERDVPTIKFRPMNIEENVSIVKDFFFLENDSIDLYNFVIKLFPQLKNIDNKLSKKEKEKIIETIVKDEYKSEKNNILNSVKNYNKLWKDYNDKYFTLLCDYFGVDFPDNLDVIDVSVGIIPVFPRYLDSYSFSIGIGISDEKLIETCAHETLHFIWFRKWMDLFPKTLRCEMDSPYLVWKYSEMVTDPILNNKPFDVFNFKERGYDSFYELTDGKEKVMDKLRGIYSRNISLEDKIKDGFDYIKKL